ncbi:tail fiber domain-containing protein [Psychroserpens sp. SPM9]|uniref:tail fiber domain-containing protein n=1 Tax=Psychroserpens sp. SPM9 TaxID=2975598 RepID=UPI0021A41252|nr:tail fiber domain-containing protein [Psychroserpens sp. SPM9]MDG5491771.1 tail fiber domain-containing protein [Psychroserpens sp. SPM9]
MKQILLIAFFCIVCTYSLCAQVGIGTTNPEASSVLDINSTDKGVLIPKVALSDVADTMLDGVNPAATGLLIFNTNPGTTGGSGVGFYYFNGTVWERLVTSLTATDDHDWYEEGTADAPDNISDDKYTLGNIAIGKNTADYPLDISSITSEYGAYLLLGGTDNNVRRGYTSNITNSGNGRQYGFQATLSGNGTNVHTGFHNYLSGSGGGAQLGVSTVINNNGAGSHFGVDNMLSGSGLGEQFGVRNRITNNGNNLHYGIYNLLSGTGNGEQYGHYNFIDNTGAGIHYGSYNLLSGSGSGIQIGDYSRIDNSGNNTHYGEFIRLNGSGSGTHNGTEIQLSGTGSGAQLGTINVIDNSGNGLHYGSYNVLRGTGTGTHYGNWTRLQSIGTGNQIGFYANINNTGDGEHYGLYSELEGNGNGIQYGIRNEITNSGSGIHYGSYNSLTGTGAGEQTGNYTTITNDGNGTHYGSRHIVSGSGSGSHIGTYNLLTGVGQGNHYAVQNNIGSSSNFNKYGVSNDIYSSGNGSHYGIYNELSGSGNGAKFGVYNRMISGAGGTHYGVFSEALKSGSYAGYFLGNVSIGTAPGNRYIMPASRGTANQVMQTDGAGNVSWATLSTPTIAAANGLNTLGSTVQLGGALNQDTTITHGIYSLIHNLNSAGDFIVQSAGLNHFEVRNNGNTYFGGDTQWYDESISGTILANLFDINDDANFYLYSNGIVQHYMSTTGNTVFNDQGLASNNFIVESDNEPYLFFVRGNLDRIGIMTTAPSHDLTIKQSNTTQASAGGLALEHPSNTDEWKIYHSGTHLSFAENGVRRAYVEAGTGSYFVTSDKRLKKNILPMTEVMQKLNTVNTYTYQYKDQQIDASLSAGFMAQELMDIFPDAVKLNEEGFYGVNYNYFTVVAIKAIQEQQNEIATLKAQNNTLETKLESLQNEIEVIKNALKNSN